MTQIKYMKLFVEMRKNEDTQKSIAKVLGISQQAISRKLSGKNEWTISEIDKICEYYNKSYYELFKDTEEQTI